MSKFTKEPTGLSPSAMSATERYASQQTSSVQQRAAEALTELDARRLAQAKILENNQRREARNQVKEYDFQSRLASNRYDPSDQGKFKMMRNSDDYMDHGYSSRMGSVQRIDDDIDYMEEAPYDHFYDRPRYGTFSIGSDLNSILRESMVNKIRADVAKRASRARSERRLLDEKYAENISDMFDPEMDGGLSGMSPSMLSPHSIVRGDYESEAASPFGILNQEQAMRRAAQVERMRKNHQAAIDRIQREGRAGKVHPNRLDANDETRREWEDLEAQRGYSIQEKYALNSVFGGDIYSGAREVNGIIF